MAEATRPVRERGRGGGQAEAWVVNRFTIVLCGAFYFAFLSLEALKTEEK